MSATATATAFDAAYWPPFHPASASATASSSSTPSPLSPQDIPHIIAQPISTPLVHYLVDRVQDAVAFGLDKSPQPSSIHSPPQSSRRARRDRDRAEPSAYGERHAFADFTSTLLRRAEVSFSVVLGALVYIHRAKPHLSIAIEEWAHHRVLMGALIAAAKYLNDASLKNAHWALCSGVFGRRDVQRIEREFLDVLDFELAVRESDLLAVCTDLAHAGVIGVPASHLPLKADRERERKRSGLDTVRRVLLHGHGHGVAGHQQQVQLQAQGRPEKRQKSESMDVDFEEERGRFKERRTEPRAAAPPSVPRLAISPASSDSAYLSSSSTSPASSNSPQTPPPPSMSMSMSAPPTGDYPHYAFHAATPSIPKSSAFPFPALPPPAVPTPPRAHAHLPAAPLPQPLPVRGFPLLRLHSSGHGHGHGPKPALPLDLDVDADFAFESPTCLVPTYRPRSRTAMAPAGTHRRSSALAMYPSVVAPVNA